MPIPNTLSCKITADFRAEKKYGGRKKFCDALKPMLIQCLKKYLSLHTHMLVQLLAQPVTQDMM